MQIRYYCFVIICLLGVVSCTHAPHSREIRKVTSVFTPDTVPEYSLKGDTLYYDPLYPTDIMVLDTFLLVAQHQDENLIHVYSLRDTTLLGKFLHQGQGPDDVVMWNGFTQGWVENGEAKLLIQSYLKSAAVLNINQTLAAARPVYEERFTFDRDSAQVILQRTNVVYKFRDKFLLSRAPERTKGLEDYNMSFQWLDYESDRIGDVVYGMNLGLVPVIPCVYCRGDWDLTRKGVNYVVLAVFFLHSVS